MTTNTNAGTAPIEDEITGLELENRVVVFTDVVGSTSLIDIHGDRVWIQALTGHLEHAAALAVRFGGEFMKNTGDGTLAVFEDCADAARFARAMIDSPTGGRVEDGGFRVQLRIGMACGTVYRWNDDYFGRTVHLAARVCAAAEPGEILMSTSCIEACRDLLSAVEDQRPVELRGFSALQSVCADRRRNNGGSGGRTFVPALESARGMINAR